VKVDAPSRLTSAVGSSYLVRFVQLAALWAYAVAQPTFSLLGGNPEFLVVRGASRAEVVVFALTLALVPALLVIAIEWLVSRVSQTASAALHVVCLALFAVPLGLLLLQGLDPSALAAVAGAVAIAALAALAYLRWRPVRLFLTLSVILPLLGLASFVFGTRLVTEDASGADVKVGRTAPVVMVVFDELPVSSLMTRDGRIDAVRYPSFARLAGSATWYPRATTVHDHTTGAVPAIVTGNLPRPGELPVLADHPQSLFTLLGESYRVRAHEEVTYLCPKRYCPRQESPFLERISGLVEDVRVAYLRVMLPDSLIRRLGLPEIADRWSGFQNTERLLTAKSFEDVAKIVVNRTRSTQAVADEFVMGLRRDEPGASLHFLHLTLPHQPWRFLPSGRQYDETDRVTGVGFGNEAWVDDPRLVAQRYQRHLLQVGYADAVLGQILDRLQRTELYDRALVVVVADHGVSFRPGVDRRPVRRENLADIARVPLFVKLPGQTAGRRDDRSVRTVDILPTVAEALSVELPSRVDGSSLLSPGARPSAVVVRGRDGELVRATVDEVDRQQVLTLRHKASLFGEGADSLFTIGRHRELLGRSAPGAGLRPVAPVNVDLDGEALFTDVRRASPFAPVRVTGTLHGLDLDGADELAVSVNGTIVALARVFDAGGATRFDALVPESSLREGANSVRLWTVRT
jgi:hypothetical protein